MGVYEKARYLTPLIRIRRMLQGARRPSWSLEYEACAELMRLYGPLLTRIPLPAFRKAAANLLGGPSEFEGFRFEPTQLGGVPGEWFRHASERNEGVLLYLHGGGYVVGSVETHRELITSFAAAAGCRAVAIDYRLAPEHRCPAQLEDAVAAYTALLDSGIDAARIVIAGESAGGGLTLATLVALREKGLPMPRAAAVISPWVAMDVDDASMHNHREVDYIDAAQLRFCAEQLLGDGDRGDPRAAPIYANLEGLPPLLIQVGGAESMLDGALRLARAAEQAGVDVTLQVFPDMVHVWHVFGDSFPQAAEAIASFGSFTEKWVREGQAK